MPEKKDYDDLPPVPSQVGQVLEDQYYGNDAVFGEITEEGPNYRSLGWIGTAALMMKSQIGLGVLSIPGALDTLGIVPGAIILLAVAIITTWSDYMVGTFKLRHREVYGLADVGGMLFGRPGKIFFGVAFVLYWIFVAGSGMLSISISLNAVSSHGACTAIFVAIAAIIGFVLGSIQTLGRMSWLAWGGLSCIITAILIVTIGVGVQNRPSAAPQDGVWVSDYQIAATPNFTDAVTAVSTIVFAYAGTPSFFSIVSEMRDPQLYSRSLFLCQSVVTGVYITIGCVVYYYCGSYVSQPALGSAGPTVKKISYGFALPGLIVTTMLVVHLPSKYIFLHLLKGSRHLTANTVTHWVAWVSCTFGIAMVSYIIASAIPIFGGLVSLVGALLGTLMSFQPMGFMWLYDNWTQDKTEGVLKWKLMVCWSVFVIVSGTFLMIAGTYGSIVSIIDSYKQSGGSAAWSCVDNSSS
ncbi:amino acid transporter [Penicillium longicatenatum]|uniref:amino acid transporter n=1 Tax=Penicillium longicatenatum TaxID=1561947 RepID=UPI002546FC36|nr:amino acid transporter [Penicillium longicatenatum]KAJ5639070.1 amino acid transporter [Penicillium longicatenatum]